MSIPILAAAIKTAVAKALADKLGDAARKAIAPTVTAAIVEDVVSTVTMDPVVKNEMNAEAPWQSRVGVGGAGGFIGGLGVLVPITASWLGYDIAPSRVVEIGFAVLAVAGPLYSLYGRFKSGLKPLFSGKG